MQFRTRVYDSIVDWPKDGSWHEIRDLEGITKTSYKVLCKHHRLLGACNGDTNRNPGRSSQVDHPLAIRGTLRAQGHRFVGDADGV